MKKLYYLDESEKERILNLHNKHKGNLLNEQAPYEIQQGGGGWTDSAKKQFDLELNNFSTGRGAFTNGIINFCKTDYDVKFPKGPSLELSTIQTFTNNITNAARQGSISTFGVTGGRGMSEAAVKEFVTNLQAFKNMANVCYSVNKLSTRGNLASGYENIFNTFDEIYANEGNYGYKSAILENLKYLASQTKVIGAEQSTEDKTGKAEKKGWELYDCVIKKGGKKLPNGNYRRYSTKLKSNVIYTDGGKFYVETGGSGTWEDYYCEGDIITPKSSQKTDNKQPNTGSGAGGAQSLAGGYIYQNAFTPEKVSVIKTAVGSTDKSGTLTQDDINKLYAKLSQK